ncbi:hypothetical protein Ahy_B06g084527 isoform F [Arachis hypogaea]|uniref:Uncharacterized protein n=1 Tax=Arachis hypogaea TaxID=3818 RepID=A0A444YS45_ARAHY|nr:hypothetical protein Ahy_B06g084527 isoform F [Arachis hypogaea]
MPNPKRLDALGADGRVRNPSKITTRVRKYPARVCKMPNPIGTYVHIRHFLYINICSSESKHSHHRHSLDIKVLPFKNGKLLASFALVSSDDSLPRWQLDWVNLENLKVLLRNDDYAELSSSSFVYVGSNTNDDTIYWAIGISSESALVLKLEDLKFCFVGFRTLVVATD